MGFFKEIWKTFRGNTEKPNIIIIDKKPFNKPQEQVLPPQERVLPPKEEEEKRSGPADKRTSLVTIVGTQKLDRDRLTPPQALQAAQEARQAGKIDQAFLILRRHRRNPDMILEFEQEWNNCINAMANNDYFPQVKNSQLAIILFNMAGFKVIKKEPIQSASQLTPMRLTLECDDEKLQRMLKTMADSPYHYYCYCLEEPLEDQPLRSIKNDLERREETVNGMIHFAVCKGISSATNMRITINRFDNNFFTIPLQRDDIRRSVVNETAMQYLRDKMATRLDNHRLFANGNPVSGKDDFFGRKDELEQIRGMVNRGQSFYLLGNQRMGKTSLIYQLKSLGAFRNHLYAFLSLEVYVDHPNFDQAVEEILRQWTADLKHKYPKIESHISSKVTASAISYDKLFAFLGGVQRQNEVVIQCFVFFDDINFVLPAPVGKSSLWDGGVSRMVRILRHYQDIVTTGFTMWNFAAVDIFEQDLHGGSGKYNRIDLKPLQAKECETMITYIGWIINMEFKPESLKAIFSVAGGHPFWTRMLCDIISRTRHSHSTRLVVTRADVEQAENDFLDVEMNYFNKLLNSLSDAEQRALRQLALRYPESVPLADLSERSLSQALTYLKYYGLVEQKADSYRLRAGLLVKHLLRSDT